jgi:hypothetical protein
MLLQDRDFRQARLHKQHQSPITNIWVFDEVFFHLVHIQPRVYNNILTISQQNCLGVVLPLSSILTPWQQQPRRFYFKRL